mgnify:CR=1 FL=1
MDPENSFEVKSSFNLLYSYSIVLEANFKKMNLDRKKFIHLENTFPLESISVLRTEDSMSYSFFKRILSVPLAYYHDGSLDFNFMVSFFIGELSSYQVYMSKLKIICIMVNSQEISAMRSITLIKFFRMSNSINKEQGSR